MRKFIQFIVLVPLIFLMSFSSVQASGSSVGAMAELVMHLNHYPDADGKELLSSIIQDRHSTATEKTLAHALSSMAHEVSGDDLHALKQLQSSTSASSREKELASILIGIAHRPSEADKQRLKVIVGGVSDKASD